MSLSRPRLLARIRRQFDVTSEILAVGPLRVPFLRVTDPQAVLDEICLRIDRIEKTTGRRVSGDEAGLPYWAELWDSALGIGQVLAARGLGETGEFAWRAGRGARILDLGCGMGLTGTVAALLGGHVVLADMEPACLLFAGYNASQYDPRVRARRVNWQTDDLGERFDLIIGSDVLYDASQWPFLISFFDLHLAHQGRVLLGEPGRESGERFVSWLTGKPWRLIRTQERVATRSVPIRLMELTRTPLL